MGFRACHRSRVVLPYVPQDVHEKSAGLILKASLWSFCDRFVEIQHPLLMGFDVEAVAIKRGLPIRAQLILPACTTRRNR
jgi:hypothetical protein